AARRPRFLARPVPHPRHRLPAHVRAAHEPDARALGALDASARHPLAHRGVERRPEGAKVAERPRGQAHHPGRLDAAVSALAHAVRLLALAALCMAAPFALAQAILAPGVERIELWPHVRVLSDPTRAASLEQV